MTIKIRPITFKNSYTPIDKSPFDLYQDFLAKYTLGQVDYKAEEAELIRAMRNGKYFWTGEGYFRVIISPRVPVLEHGEIIVTASHGDGKYVGMGDSEMRYEYRIEQDGLNGCVRFSPEHEVWPVVPAGNFDPNAHDLWNLFVYVTNGNNEQDDAVITQIFDASPDWARATLPQWLENMAPSCGRENGWRGWGSHLFSRIRLAYHDWEDSVRSY